MMFSLNQVTDAKLAFLCRRLELASTLMLTGLIWVVQIVHYPLLKYVGSESFKNYERLHCSTTSRNQTLSSGSTCNRYVRFSFLIPLPELHEEGSRGESQVRTARF
jgi:hypothetical protein